ncbi:MAG: site-specific DNA-methyltransferase [Planctomycetes bacterium]|nr:site-specific DNA-methyltransferase [Planctomycetota bacterium]
MARKKNTGSNLKPIDQYEHKDKQRLNNPPVGLVDAHTDNGGQKKKTYQYDPHLDPQLQWAGKAEHTSFDVPTVSLHVHERIDPRRIIETVRKEDNFPRQLSLFEGHKKPLREAIEFYKHKEDWSNRLIAGDSLLVMNSLLEKEGMGGKVQMVFFDPPYGIKYGSNFQPFVNKRNVDDGNDDDLTAEPEMIKAFRDTWELGIHSYLSYIRDRLLLTKELLSDEGSVFVQINDNNLHLIKAVMDEVFGYDNCVNIIPFKKRASFLSRFGKGLFELFDYIIWYAKDIDKVQVNTLYVEANKTEVLRGEFRYYDDENGIRNISEEDINNPKLDLSKVFRTHSASKKSKNPKYTDPIKINGNLLIPPSGHEWKTDPKGMERLKQLNRLVGNSPTRPYKIYYTDFPYQILNNLWDDTLAEQHPIYAVQTDELPIQRCLLLTTMPGDLVLDITCGSGTTAYVAEQWGRRWITCDTSRVAITLAKQRLLTANFDYYELAYLNEGVGSGFKYKSAKRLKLEILANNLEPEEILFLDKPIPDTKKTRVTGPFTVEAVPAPVAKSFEEVNNDISQEADNSVARSGETLRQNNWRDELLRAGVRAKGGKLIEFTRVEPLSGTRYLQAEAETKEENPKRVLVCFGPEHAPLEQRMVELALEEAAHMKPKPQIVLFCAFQFDEEASKDIDETNWPGVTMLKAQMNADLLTDDLKKKRSSNESFWLIGQPDIVLRPAIASGTKQSKKNALAKSQNDKQYVVEVLGFDYYNPKTGTVESGGKGDIAMWMLDTDYDGRSLFPSQVFFPMAGDKEGWATLARNLKAEIVEEKTEAFRGTVSLHFTPGKAVAVKIIDARGIESLKIIRL